MAREIDAATGLYYVRARWYDPTLERFVSEDPIGLAGGINPYAYVENDPVNHTDPSGLKSCSWYSVRFGSVDIGTFNTRIFSTGCIDLRLLLGTGSAYGRRGSGGWEMQSPIMPKEDVSDALTGPNPGRVGDFAGCVAGTARANTAELDRTVSGWFGDAAFLVENSAKYGAGMLAAKGLTGSGLETSGNWSFVGRWLVNKSWRFEKPLMVQGIKVGAARTGAAVSTLAVGAGIGTNVLAAAGVHVSLRSGVWIGSGIVGVSLCSLE